MRLGHDLGSTVYGLLARRLHRCSVNVLCDGKLVCSNSEDQSTNTALFGSPLLFLRLFNLFSHLS